MGKTLTARMARTIGAAAVILGAITGAAIVAAPAASASTTASTGVTAPATESPEPDSGIVQHPTKFLRGVWFDQGKGNAFVAAPLLELTPGYGWLASPWERVIVQKLTRRGIRTVATLDLTNAEGIARGTFHVGAGVHYLRVVHTPDVFTYGTTGAWRRVVVTARPLIVD